MGRWERRKRRETQCSIHGGRETDRALVPKEGAWWSIFSRYLEAAAEQAPAPTQATGPACPPLGALTELGLRAAGRWARGRWGAQDTPKPQTQVPPERQREAPLAPSRGIIWRRCPFLFYPKCPS